ncbi:MAG TPA: 5-formyltetrahydrofolate cyclo-ligase, partial [Hyphomicrobiales bacterium]|nr:5-formyltetrahydrofolate cyclo-ligase [Hyphomicrobiales bacterium]
PAEEAAVVRPDVLLVPLLAFDRAGFRLGYGGGFYDRSLEQLRSAGPVAAIGLAYSAQQTDECPRESFDQPLDAILTEDGPVLSRRIKAGG